MLRILFVDDEPNILQGMRRATRGMRAEWDMHFVDSGPAGLEILAGQHFDVVVSDMRMPGMDGAQFLARVRTESPSAARIILSGYAEEEAVFRSTQVAHQFLSKPCDVEELKHTIEQIRSAAALVEQESIRALVGKVEQLPALGDVYQDLTMAIQQATSTNESLARIVAKDIALTAHLVRLVNSAFFGLSREVESVGQAIGFLGIDVVRAIVAGHSLFGADVPGVDVQQLAVESQIVAGLARKAARSRGATALEAAEAYLAGSLHQVGALVLGSLSDVDPVELRAVLTNGDITNERLLLDADRYAVGSYLLGLWGFAPVVVESIRLLADPVDIDADLITWAVRVARETVTARRPQIDAIEADGGEMEPLLLEVATDLAETGHLSMMLATA